MFESGARRSFARTALAVLLALAALGGVLAVLVLAVLDDPDAAGDLLASPDFLDRLAFSLAQAGIATAIGLAAGLPASWLLSRGGLPARELLAFALAAPLAIPGVVVALGIERIADGEVVPRVLVVGAHAIFATAAVTWLVTPAWAAGDAHASEDARVLGAGRLGAYFAGTGRHLRHAVQSAAALAFWYAFAAAGTVAILGGADATTMESGLAFGQPATFGRPEVNDALSAESSAVALPQVVVGVVVLLVGGTRWPHPATRRPRAHRAVAAIGSLYLLALIGVSWAPAVAVVVEAVDSSALGDIATATVAGHEGGRLLAWTGILGAASAALATLLAWPGALIAGSTGGGRRSWIGRGVLALPVVLTGATAGWAGLLLADRAGFDLDRTYVLTIGAHALIAYPFALRVLGTRRRAPRVLLEDAVLLGATERSVRWHWLGRRTAMALGSAALLSFVLSACEVAAANLLTPGEATPAALGVLRGWEGDAATPGEVYGLGAVLTAATVIAFATAEWLRRAATRMETG